jgi:26S proteasome regulatory subunit N5
MSDNTVLKATKDHTKDVDALLPEAEKLAKVQRPSVFH